MGAPLKREEKLGEHDSARMNDEALAQRLLCRLEYLLDELLCNYSQEEKDGILAKGTFEDKRQWRPYRNVCDDCKRISHVLRNANESMDGA